MMKVVEINENSTLAVDSELAEDINTSGVLSDPRVTISGGKLVLPRYTVGEVRLLNHTIVIKPLNSSLTVSSVFDMFAYTETGQEVESDIDLDGSLSSSADGFDAVIETFVKMVERLLSFGITGVYRSSKSWKSKPKGRIDFSDYHKAIVATKGLNTEYHQYTSDSISNRIIKTALHDIARIKKSYVNPRLLDYFKTVKVIEGGLSTSSERLALTEYSSNPYHSKTLSYAMLFMKDLKIGYSNTGGITPHTFLVNSNFVYENYVRSILQNYLEDTVQKPSRPLTFAINSNQSNDLKIAEPDILINYNPGAEIAQVVVDAKNKSINHTKPLTSISTSDVYQIVYYSQAFSTKAAALLYPTTGRLDPVRFNTNTPSKSKFYLLTVDMSKSLQSRHQEVIADIKKIMA